MGKDLGCIEYLLNWGLNRDVPTRWGIGSNTRKRGLIMKKRTKRSLVLSAIILGTSGIALADTECGLKTLQGSFAFTASGYTLVAGVAQPKAIIEVIEFKGDGTLSSPSSTRSVNGVIVPGPLTPGTYSVDTGCTGTITFTPGPTFDTIVAPNGQKVWMVQTNSNNIFAGTAEIIPKTDQACGLDTLRGAYGLQISGTRPAPFVAPGGPGYVGQFEQIIGTVVQTFDGKGTFTQVDNVKGTIAGIVPDRPGRGTYSVNPDCSITQIVMPPGQTPIMSKGVIVDGGKEFRTNTITPDSFLIMTYGRKI